MSRTNKKPEAFLFGLSNNITESDLSKNSVKYAIVDGYVGDVNLDFYSRIL
jgi:hypothetical protein